MKFLVLASHPESLLGFRLPLIKALIREGFDVYVAAPDMPVGSLSYIELDKIGVTIHQISMQRVGMNPLTDIFTLFNLFYLMLKIKPDFLISYTIKPVIYGTLAAWIARVPKRFALITGLGYAFMDDASAQRTRIRAVVEFLYRKALRHCQAVFFQNPDDELLFRRLEIISENANSCVVNGSGVDVIKFAFKSHVEHAEPRFLLIARLLGDKGVREYAEAAKKVKQQYPEVRFDLVGWIDVNPNAIALSELDEWTNSGTINFLGRLNDVRPVIKECSVYVLPSYREGTPRTVLEAMAMGRAVITTDAPGCRETVVDGDNGFLVPIKNADALAQAMLRFIEQPELIAKMGQRSRAIAEEKYDVHKVNAQMLEGMGLV